MKKQKLGGKKRTKLMQRVESTGSKIFQMRQKCFKVREKCKMQKTTHQKLGTSNEGKMGKGEIRERQKEPERERETQLASSRGNRVRERERVQSE